MRRDHERFIERSSSVASMPLADESQIGLPIRYRSLTILTVRIHVTGRHVRQAMQ
jgi:hypothetical protein